MGLIYLCCFSINLVITSLLLENKKFSEMINESRQPSLYYALIPLFIFIPFSTVIHYIYWKCNKTKVICKEKIDNKLKKYLYNTGIYK